MDIEYIKMEHLNKNYFNNLINLDTFSRLPFNTDIHLSKIGYFIPTAGKLSGIVGAQTISNMYNGYNSEQLALDLHQYFKETCENVQNMIEIAYYINEFKHEMVYKIKLLKKAFKNAYGNEQYGLFCLLKTYEYTNIYQQLFESILYFRDKMYEFKNKTNSWKLNCEYRFTDNDWECYLNNCTKLQYETITLYKYYLQYSTSLAFNQFMNYAKIWNWYDLIYDVNNKIYLGAMPLKSGPLTIESRNDLLTLQSLNIGAVLSVVECFENQSSGLLYTPITPLEWKSVGIKFLQLPIPDFMSINMNKIELCVEFIQWNMINQRNIYISCRAGKNRSTLVLMCYFVKYLNFNADNAYQYIKSKRIQVQNKHLTLLQEYEKLK